MTTEQADATPPRCAEVDVEESSSASGSSGLVIYIWKRNGWRKFEIRES